MNKCLKNQPEENQIIPKPKIHIEVLMPTLLKNQFDENFGFIPINLEQVLEMTKKNPDYIFVQGGTGKYEGQGAHGAYAIRAASEGGREDILLVSGCT